MTSRAPALLLLVAFLASCGAETSGPARDGGVSGAYVSDGLPAPFDEGDELRITFGDGRIDYSVGCNGFGAEGSWDDGVLRVGGISATEMGCPGDGNAEETWLSDFLGSGPELTTDGTDVRLAGDGAGIWLVPADEAPSGPGRDVALEGTRWRLVGIEQVDGDAVSMTGAGRYDARLVVEGRSLTFDTTCNAGGGRVRVVGDRLRLAQVAVTLRGCLGSRGELEQQVMAVLGGRWVDWRIDGRELRLSAGDTSLVYRAARAG